MSMIAILLFVGVVTGGINYVNQDGMNISKDASVINSAYLAIKADVANYAIKQPETPSSLDQVYPQSAYYPALPGKMNFKSLTKTASDEIYVCISVVKNPTNFGSTSRLKRDRSTERMFLNNTCGATDDQNYDNLSSSYYLTIYL
jgi:hypothetical protein